MRSPADRLRVQRLAEVVARAAAVVLLLLILYEVTRSVEERVPLRTGDTHLAHTLAAATMSAGERGLVLRFARVPDPVHRDWAAALRRAGALVQWSGESNAPIAASVERIADPRGGHELRVWRGAEDPVRVRDAAGELTRLDPAAGLSVVSLQSALGTVQVEGPRQRAVVPLADSRAPGAVLVLGRAGWEARFLLRTLEEIGWTVHGRLSVAPGVSVEQGRPGALDTARYAAVIVLDSSVAPHAASIVRYAGQGGGVILAGEGATAPGLASLALGSGSARLAPTGEALPQAEPFEGLPARTVGRVHEDAVVLRARGDRPTVAARRVGAGRVLHAGYEDSWRVRMELSGSPELHRAWWAGLVSSVAYLPYLPDTAVRGRGEQVPLAALIDALGEPQAYDPGAAGRRTLPVLLLFTLAIALLLLEWFSRRLRGAP